VANAFFRAGFIESWGRGIEKIITESQRYNATTPQFRYDGGLWVSFQSPVIIEEKSSATQDGTKMGPSRDQVTLMTFCSEERTLQEMMELSKRSNRTKYRDQVLGPMMEEGWIEMTIPDKPTSKNQRYRLSAIGLKLIQQGV
jgi:ATP-dependent DNA helicase RecG